MTSCLCHNLCFQVLRLWSHHGHHWHHQHLRTDRYIPILFQDCHRPPPSQTVKSLPQPAEELQTRFRSALHIQTSGLKNRSSPDQPASHLQQPSISSTISIPCRADHSNETALLKIINDLLHASDRSEISILTLLDLSAAFDTTDHSILLQRLQDTCGIHHTAPSWLRTNPLLMIRNWTLPLIHATSIVLSRSFSLSLIHISEPTRPP